MRKYLKKETRSSEGNCSNTENKKLINCLLFFIILLLNWQFFYLNCKETKFFLITLSLQLNLDISILYILAQIIWVGHFKGYTIRCKRLRNLKIWVSGKDSIPYDKLKLIWIWVFAFSRTFLQQISKKMSVSNLSQS